VALVVSVAQIACSTKGPETPGDENLLLGLSLSPTSISLPPGRTVPVAVTLTRAGGFVEPVTVSASGLPSGVSAPPTNISGNSGVINLSAAAAADLNNGVPVTITASQGKSSVSATLMLSVNSAGFSLAVTPATVGVGQGSSGSATVTVTREAFAGTIVVTATGLPDGVTADGLSLVGNRGNLVFHVTRAAAQGASLVTVRAVGGTATVTALLNFLVLPPGGLDVSFGVNGQVTTNYDSDGGTTSTLTAVAVQPDGKIVIVGTRTRPSFQVGDGCGSAHNQACLGVVIARYNSDGTLDPTFVGPDAGNPPPPGAVVILEDVQVNSTTPSAVAISDAGILVAGTGSLMFETLIRLTANGAFDTTFNPGGGRPGRAPMTIKAKSVAVVSGDRILVAGQTISSLFAVVRYQPDGTLDQTFGDGGYVFQGFDGGTSPSSTTGGALIAGDTAKVVGQATVAGKATVAIMSFDAGDNGSIDSSFNGNGQVLIQLGSNTSTANAVVGVDGGNTVVIATTRNAASHADTALASFQPDGGLDTSFGDGGIARTIFDPDAGNSLINGAASFGDKIAVVGRFMRTGVLDRFLVLRYTSDGAADSNFGTNGPGILIDVPQVLNSANAFNGAVFQLDGKLIAVGTLNQSGRNRPVIVRFVP
jgi:uncharacterized delta-60 repeat protein